MMIQTVRREREKKGKGSRTQKTKLYSFPSSDIVSDTQKQDDKGAYKEDKKER